MSDKNLPSSALTEKTPSDHTLAAVPFPDVPPSGYEWFDDEPTFDPERHLALEEPDEVTTLKDLGYSDADIADKATPVAVSSPFRVLSDGGAETMLAVARRLKQYHRPAGDRIERMTRGGCYRSQWLRDLCISPEVNAHLANIYGIDIAPHPMPVHLGHLNYEPTTIQTAVDKWHHDTLPLDYVMAVTDLANTPGGGFEIFTGTKHEAADLAAAGQRPPAERVVSPALGPGCVVALHGDMVVHRGAPMTEQAERITMVNGYVSIDPNKDEQSRTRDLIVVDDHEALWTEWAKFAAWRARGRLTHLIDQLDFNSDMESVAAQLEAAVADVNQAVTEMRAGEQDTSHYE